MKPELANALSILSPTQRRGVDWGEGAALVLAGPGVGKTTVLTARIARLLEESRNRHFRILALTFTTKAGDEMRNRVEALAPGFTDRTVIGTFHSFCAQILRQHGSHMGIKPDFGVYDQDSDREELLKDGLREAAAKGQNVSVDDVRQLRVIDRLRGGLISPAKTAARFRDQIAGGRIANIYEIYESRLRMFNVADFNGMILDVCRLAHQVPAVAARIRQSYPYWLIDEFQDTTPAQYKMLRFIAGNTFRNIFAVADDDQIIYQWAGASYQQIVSFRENFSPELIQLVENRRCPPVVVAAANNLIRYNSDRTPGKESLIAVRPTDIGAIEALSFITDKDEVAGIAESIALTKRDVWGQTCVLARTRSMLQPVLEALRGRDVQASIVTRRDRFVSPHFVWLHACLDQAIRPTDRRVFEVLVAASNKIASLALDAALIAAEGEAAGIISMEAWARQASATDQPVAARLAGMAQRLVQSRTSWKAVTTEALAWLPTLGGANGVVASDIDEDKAAWEVAVRALRAEKGDELELAELLQGLALRPKEPPPTPDTVSLLTIHAAKGLEFDHVWVMGLAESVLPSWQSLQETAAPAELEEERRNCFVAITRTKHSLRLTRAQNYRGWKKQPSRFLEEMGIAQPSTDEALQTSTL